MSSSIPKEGIPEVLTHEVSTDDNETHENNNNNIITKPENINEMPNEMLILFLARLSPLELLTSVSLVCKKWRECVHTVCLTKPVTLVFYGNYYKLELNLYSVYHTESKQALNFYDVPFASDSCALYRPFSRLCLSPQSLNFENITELVFCGEYKHFVRSINAENFREFIQKYCKNLTHLKLLGANLSWECLRTGTFEFDFQSTIWRVLEQIQLTTLRHVSISSNQRNCMLGAESLLPKLTQFYFEWSIDFMPSLRLLNTQTCTSIGIYWQGQQEYAQIKFNLTQLREQLPTIWQRISRINDRKINRHTFKPEKAIVNLINPQSLRYLQLHINMCSDYVAYYKLVAQLSRLEHLAIQIVCPQSSIVELNNVFQFAKELHAMRTEFPTHKATSIKRITVCAPCEDPSDIFMKIYGTDFTFENTFVPTTLLFPSIESMRFVYFESKTSISIIADGKWSFNGEEREMRRRKVPLKTAI